MKEHKIELENEWLRERMEENESHTMLENEWLRERMVENESHILLEIEGGVRALKVDYFVFHIYFHLSVAESVETYHKNSLS